MIGVGVIGYGYWGPNLVRNLVEHSDSRVVAVCDLQAERLSVVRGRYPNIAVTTDPTELFSNPAIEAIVIATPVSSHFELAQQALRADKHTLVEKPLAASSEQALHLIELAEQRNRILMVDHTFVYTGAVRKIKELVENNDLGDLYYYDSVRVNLGLFQHDVNVIWDLAVHDLSVMDFVLPMRPHGVVATGMSHISGQPENIAYLTLLFENNFIAHIHVNWLAPVKVRRTLLGGSKRMIVYNDLEPGEKIKVYDKGVTVNDNPESVYQMLVGYRTGDMWSPQLDVTEALRAEVHHFIDCIKQNTTPVTDGWSGLRVVRILEAATRSMQSQSRPVELEMEIFSG